MRDNRYSDRGDELFDDHPEPREGYDPKAIEDPEPYVDVNGGDTP